MKIPSMIKTSSGLRVDPLNPDPSSVNLKDVLAALGRQIRYNGHVDFSVRDHTIIMYRIYELLRRPAVEFCAQIPFGEELGQRTDPDEYLSHLMGLLILTHDMPEAYIGDMVQPLKQNMPEFKAVDDRILPIVMHGIIGEAVYQVLYEKTMGRGMDQSLTELLVEMYATQIVKFFSSSADLDVSAYLTHSLNLLDRNICDHLEMPCLHGPLDQLSQARSIGLAAAAPDAATRLLLASYLLNYAQSTKATLRDVYDEDAFDDILGHVGSRMTSSGRLRRAQLTPQQQFEDDLSFFQAKLRQHVVPLMGLVDRYNIQAIQPFESLQDQVQRIAREGFEKHPTDEQLKAFDAMIEEGMTGESKPWEKDAFRAKMNARSAPEMAPGATFTNEDGTTFVITGPPDPLYRAAKPPETVHKPYEGKTERIYLWRDGEKRGYNLPLENSLMFCVRLVVTKDATVRRIACSIRSSKTRVSKNGHLKPQWPAPRIETAWSDESLQDLVNDYMPGYTAHYVTQQDVLIQCPDGRMIHVSVCDEPIKDDDQATLEGMKVLHDKHINDPVFVDHCAKSIQSQASSDKTKESPGFEFVEQGEEHVETQGAEGWTTLSINNNEQFEKIIKLFGREYRALPHELPALIERVTKEFYERRDAAEAAALAEKQKLGVFTLKISYVITGGDLLDAPDPMGPHCDMPAAHKFNIEHAQFDLLAMIDDEIRKYLPFGVMLNEHHGISFVGSVDADTKMPRVAFLYRVSAQSGEFSVDNLIDIRVKADLCARQLISGDNFSGDIIIEMLSCHVRQGDLGVIPYSGLTTISYVNGQIVIPTTEG